MQNKYIVSVILQCATFIIIPLVIMRIATYSNYLSPNELTHAISGKTGIHQSLSAPNRFYKTSYNLDNTFVMHTMENCGSVGTTTGHYKVISNYNIGYIDVTYDYVHNSPLIESIFNKHAERNVHKTMKNLLGPFTLHHDANANRNGNILEYNCGYTESKMFMTMFDND
jgi:Domain of unknown function (DUF758)